LGRKTVSEDLLASTPAVFVAWDLLYATGRVLINEPLEARRAKLEELIPANLGTLRLSEPKDSLTRRRLMMNSMRPGRGAMKG